MADLLLDSSGDLDLSTNELVLVDGDDALLQHLRIRFQFFKGEWFLDVRVGLPYLQSILLKNPNLVAVRSFFRDAILTTPGLAQLESFDMTVDASTRVMRLVFSVAKDDGGILNFDQEFIVG